MMRRCGRGLVCDVLLLYVCISCCAIKCTRSYCTHLHEQIAASYLMLLKAVANEVRNARTMRESQPHFESLST